MSRTARVLLRFIPLSALVIASLGVTVSNSLSPGIPDTINLTTTVSEPLRASQSLSDSPAGVWVGLEHAIATATTTAPNPEPSIATTTTTTTITTQPTTQPATTTLECGGWLDLVSAYFPADQVHHACEVLLCESGGNPRAISHTDDHGIFQLNRPSWERRFPEVTGQPFLDGVYDPEANIRFAAWLQSEAGWGQWVCHRGA